MLTYLGFTRAGEREAETRRTLLSMRDRLGKLELVQERLLSRLASLEEGQPAEGAVRASAPEAARAAAPIPAPLPTVFASPPPAGPPEPPPAATPAPPPPLFSDLPATPVAAPPPAMPPGWEPPAAPGAPEAAPAASTELPPPLPPLEPPPPAPPPAPRPAPFQLPKIDWERLVGVKLFSWAAGGAVAIAAVLWARYAVDNGLITPPIRMAVGVVVGLGLLLGAETRRAQAYRVTAQALAAGGVVALFSTFFAAHVLWRLIPAGAAFGLLALVAAVAVLISVRRDALVMSLLGLLGGFATPALISTGQNNPLGLFGYLLLLDVGLAWVAYRKRWPLLSALSLGLTGLYQAGWVAKMMERDRLPIAFAAFLIFPVVGLAGLFAGSRRAAGDGAPVDRLTRWTAAAASLPPALLALHLASSGRYAEHWPLVLGFLAVVAVGLAAVAAWQGPEWLHLAGGATVLLTLAGFLAGNHAQAREAWPALGWATLGLAALYLAAPAVLERLGRALRAEGRLAVLTAPATLFVFAAMALTPQGAAPAGLLLPALLVAAASSAVAVWRAEGRLHLLGAVLLLLALVCWSAQHLDATTLLPALLAYAAAGGLLLAAPLLAERRGRPLAGGAPGPFLLAALGLLLFVAGGPAAHAAVASLAGLTALAALLQAALFFEAWRGRSALFALGGVAMGFVTLALWALTGLAGAVLPALVAGAALAAVALAGSLLAGRRAAAPQLDVVPHLALAAHLLVAVVAARPALAAPAWPWLAVLAVLDLAYLAAALLRRRSAILLGPAALTVVVLLAHLIGMGVEPPSPTVAGWAALGFAALFLGAFLAARRTGAEPAAKAGAGAAAAATALHGGQLVLLLAAAPHTLPLSFLVPAHLALGVGLLALAWLAPLEALAVSGALAGALAAPLLRLGSGTGAEALWLATPAWLLALAYPLLRARRAPAERLPFLGAVLASFAYLLVARTAWVDLGLSGYLGALPVAQALLLVPHLVLLRRLAGSRSAPQDLGRFALVAAAVLGLATVAVPLQLERQWITLGWALEGAALAWLWRRVPHRGLLVWSAALLAAVFLRLGLNPSILEYAPRSATPILNWYLYTYAISAAAFFLAARWLSGGEDRLLPGTPRLSPLAGAGGGVLLFLLVNIEVADFWSTGPRIAFEFSAGLAQDLSYTLAWAAFSVATLAAGVALRSRATRLAAILLMVAAALKGVFHDLHRLEGLYKIGAFTGLAIALALVALLLQRFVLRAPPAAPGAAPAPAAPPPPENR
ncbi:MAG: DUF2339 domain-containing protein [Anaeromyxobacter sp.]